MLFKCIKLTYKILEKIKTIKNTFEKVSLFKSY